MDTLYPCYSGCNFGYFTPMGVVSSSKILQVLVRLGRIVVCNLRAWQLEYALHVPLLSLYSHFPVSVEASGHAHMTRPFLSCIYILIPTPSICQ